MAGNLHQNPFLENLLQFFPALFQVIGMSVNPEEAGYLPVEGTILWQYFVFCLAHCCLDVVS